MSRISWLIIILIAAFFAVLNFMDGCPIGRILLIFVSVWAFLVFLICCKLVTFLSRRGPKIFHTADVKKLVYPITTVFSLIFLVMTVATVVGHPDEGGFLGWINNLSLYVEVVKTV